jgi:hypothetical protein
VRAVVVRVVRLPFVVAALSAARLRQVTKSSSSARRFSSSEENMHASS